MIALTGQVLEGTFLRRYKRFFADVQLIDGAEIVAHTPNTGSMKGLCDEGNLCLVSYHPSPTRKLQYTLQAIKVKDFWVGCNTSLPNPLVAFAIQNKRVPQLTGYQTIRREVPYGPGKRSRIDLLLTDHEDNRPDVFVEVKNVTFKEGEFALFPDAVTIRGQKHLFELINEVKAGHRAAMIFLVQREDCIIFSPAKKIDPEYVKALIFARDAGVELLCLTARIDKAGIRIVGELPVVL
jgi:sugar fermentation stimulation protein A